MKKVGELWQTLLLKKEGTKYFQDKANQDKLRYLQEQRDFYDEVDRIAKEQIILEGTLVVEDEDDAGIDNPDGMESMNNTSGVKRRNSSPLEETKRNKRQKVGEESYALESEPAKNSISNRKLESNQKSLNQSIGTKRPPNSYQIFAKQYKNDKSNYLDQNSQSLKAGQVLKACQFKWNHLTK